MSEDNSNVPEPRSGELPFDDCENYYSEFT